MLHISQTSILTNDILALYDIRLIILRGITLHIDIDIQRLALIDGNLAAARVAQNEPP